MSAYTLHHGDCLEVLRAMPDNSVDAIVTDPPYGLEFMGKEWDAPWKGDNRQPGDDSYTESASRHNNFVRYGMSAGYGGDLGAKMRGFQDWSEQWAREALRVLKPGGHLLAFSGSRTYHRMACAIEDAGFEIRDQIMWLYGCLDERTEVATIKGVIPYHKAKVGDLVLCYDLEQGRYSYQPILEIVEYDYSDTAYRLVGDFGEQVVSRNHRCIIERSGSEIFECAEALQREARVPVLEDLPALQRALYSDYASAGYSEPDLQLCLQGGADRRETTWPEVAGSPQGEHGGLRGMREVGMETRCLAAQDDDANMQPSVQWKTARRGMDETCLQGACSVDASLEPVVQRKDGWSEQSRVERRRNVPQAQGAVRKPSDQVRTVPGELCDDGTPGRLRGRAPTAGSTSDRKAAYADGGGSPHRPQCDQQRHPEFDAVCNERGAQGVRAWRGHKTAVVRVVPFQYIGKVWCLRVPTGAFVAVRDGVAFPTGNSGFPKSHNLRGQHEGKGTALKPAHEPICMARKPLVGTVLANVEAHGTGALNIDACRVPVEDADYARNCSGDRGHEANRARNMEFGMTAGSAHEAGRWPANVAHDGSEEVVALFPAKAGAAAPVKGSEAKNTYGEFARVAGAFHSDQGSAARFFYCAKASKADRDEGMDAAPDRILAMSNQAKAELARGNLHAGDSGMNTAKLRKNHHPTVKPTALMAWLVRLVTPLGGVVLDPFMGSGSTGKACMFEGFDFIGIEREAEYLAVAEARIAHAQAEAEAVPPSPQLGLFGEDAA